MEISKEKILDLSNQIYMGLSEEEIQKLCIDVGMVVESTALLKEVDVTDVMPDIAVLSGYYNAFRKDEVVEYKEKEKLFRNSKEVENSMFKIPKIV